MVVGAIRKSTALLLLLFAVACAAPVVRHSAQRVDHRCANSYMRAMTHTDFDGMYACMGGDLRHRLEERADARNRTPTVQLEWDQAKLELAANGDYRLLKAKRAPQKFQVLDQQEALLYRFGTTNGPMAVVLLLDHSGLVGGRVGPFYSSD